MKHFLIFILFLPVLAGAQRQQTYYTQDTVLTMDSLSRPLLQNWRYSPRDSPGMALPGYNDTGWVRVSAENLKAHNKQVFTGSGWFRLHFYADTSLCKGPLGLQITHFGASEIYIDGERITAYGTINGKDSSKYYDPQVIPVTFSLHHPGYHVLAVRYANWNALSTNPIYKRRGQGFRIYMANADDMISNQHYTTVALGSAFMTLFGIFLALFILHLIFFLYNRHDRSNLLFSLFSLCLALLFFIPYLSKVLHGPVLIQTLIYSSIFLIILTCFFLSGFLNMLFSRKKTRLYIIGICSIITAIIYMVDLLPGLVAMSILIGLISLESVFLIIRAMVRKVPGARIIGSGLLLLAFFLLAVIIVLLVSGQDINDSNLFGRIMELLLVVAILSIPISMSAYLARNFAAVSSNLKLQLIQVKELSEKSIQQEVEKQRYLEGRKEELEREVSVRTKEVIKQKEEIEEQHSALKAEKKKTDDLLLNILPEEIAEELKETGSSAARLYDNVTVLFTDFVDFTQMSEALSPAMLVAEIDHCFKAFDGIIGKHGLEKIKTVGDAYIAVSGLPITNANHAQDVVKAAIDIRDFIEQRKRSNPDSFAIRLGIHSGPVVAGIVGVKKFAYDIWGDTVNTAARMEQNSETGKINISATTYEIVKNQFACTYRGEIEAKHKGKMGMYFVTNR